MSLIGLVTDAPAILPVGVEFERHFSIKEIAGIWGLSEPKIREIFSSEPGVLSFGEPEKRFKRGYITLRVPESVVRRVHRRLTMGRAA